MIYMSRGGHIKLVEESAVPKWKALGYTPVMSDRPAEKRKRSNGKDGD